jgi:hypothetical protein
MFIFVEDVRAFLLPDYSISFFLDLISSGVPGGVGTNEFGFTVMMERKGVAQQFSKR